MAELGARVERAHWQARLASLSQKLLGKSVVAPVAIALAVDAYVHVTDGYFYETNGGGIITQANLFYAEAAVAVLVAVLILFRPTLTSWIVALVVATTALGAVVLYRYVDVGAIGPIPDLYEPTWDVPGKLLSAYAEGFAALLSIPGVVTTLAARRHRGRAPRT